MCPPLTVYNVGASRVIGDVNRAFVIEHPPTKAILDQQRASGSRTFFPTRPQVLALKKGTGGVLHYTRGLGRIASQYGGMPDPQGPGTPPPRKQFCTRSCSKYPQQVCRGFARLLSRGGKYGARVLACWRSTLATGSPRAGGRCGQTKGVVPSQAPRTSEQLRKVVHFLQEMEIRCERCLAQQTGTCRLCHTGWCTRCPRAEAECEICSAPVASMAAPGEIRRQRAIDTDSTQQEKEA